MKYIRLEEQGSPGKGQWIQWGNTSELDDALLNQMDDLDKRAQECMPEVPKDLVIRASTAAHIRNHFNQKQKDNRPVTRLYQMMRYPLLAAASVSLFFLFVFAQDDVSGNNSPKVKPTFADTVHSLHQSLNPQEDSIRDQLMLDVN